MITNPSRDPHEIFRQYTGNSYTLSPSFHRQPTC